MSENGKVMKLVKEGTIEEIRIVEGKALHKYTVTILETSCPGTYRIYVKYRVELLEA